MAFDPFSGASKPLPPELFSRSSSKDPLPFGAVPRFPSDQQNAVKSQSSAQQLLPPFGGLLAPVELLNGPTDKENMPSWRDGALENGKMAFARHHSAQQPSHHARHESLLPAFSSLELHRRQMPTSSSSPGSGTVANSSVSRTPGGGGHEEADVGSDEWMRRKVAQCVDRVESRLDLNNLGLTQLSSHVGELARFVELKPKSRSSRDPSASSFSPAAAAAGPGFRPQTPRTVSSTLLPPAASSPSLNGAGAGGLQENQVPRGATGLVVTPLASFQAREFGRISSAPAAVAGVSSPSSSALLQLQMQTQTQQRTPLGASSSGAGARGGNLLPSHSHSHSPIVGGIDDPRTTYARTSSRGFEPPGSPVLPEDYQHPSQPRPTPTTTLKARSPFGALGTAGGGGAPRRPMDRTSSLAPPPTPGGSIIATSSPKGSDREGWRRTPSGTYVNPKKDSWSGDGSGDLEVSMANNQLTRLPTALFSISNLVQLSLRSNQLTHLPAAISQLKNLKELNIALNKIETLPPTILDLDLRNFIHTLNPLRSKTQASWHPKSKRWLAPVERRRSDGCGYDSAPFERNVAPLSLREMALAVLLSSREPHHLPPLLTETDWSPETSDELHALEDASALQRKVPALSEREAQRIIASVRSATDDNASSRLLADGAPAPPAFSSTDDGRRFGRASTSRATSDDAEINPYFSPCPNPAHHVTTSNSNVTRRVYLHEPVERRIEWVKVSGTTDELPILWKGCSNGCLDFLEEEEEKEVQGTTAMVEQAEDGFDADLLAGENVF